MTGVAAWWRALSAPEKFRLYTRLSLQAGIAAAAVAVSVAVPWSRHGLWPVIEMVVAALAGVIAVNVQPALSIRPGTPLRRWALLAAAATVIVVWSAGAVLAHRATDEPTVTGARVAGIFAIVIAAVALIPFVRHTWFIVVGVSIATAVAFAASPGAAFWAGVTVLLVAGSIVGLMLLTLWGLRLFNDLERSKDVEAELHLAEERLRFGRDLHDVVGRGFSAIAMKSELAAALSRSGSIDLATAEMDAVKALAVESMEELRALVRGYRDIDLAGEVAGARSLLSAAGCRLVVEGDPAKLPPHLHEVSAWVVREGTTNIVRHSSATSATLALGSAGISLRNDGAVGAPRDRSGLRGLAERLADVGATLDTTASGNEFVLEIRWETR